MGFPRIGAADAMTVINGGESGRLGVFRNLGLSVGNFKGQQKKQGKHITKGKRAKKTICQAEDDDYNTGAFYTE